MSAKGGCVFLQIQQIRFARSGNFASAARVLDIGAVDAGQCAREIRRALLRVGNLRTEFSELLHLALLGVAGFWFVEKSI